MKIEEIVLKSKLEEIETKSVSASYLVELLYKYTEEIGSEDSEIACIHAGLETINEKQKECFKLISALRDEI